MKRTPRRGLCEQLRNVPDAEMEESSCIVRETSQRRERSSSERELSKTPVSSQAASRSRRRGETHTAELSRR
jgi:hypothetical protein